MDLLDDAARLAFGGFRRLRVGRLIAERLGDDVCVDRGGDRGAGVFVACLGRLVVIVGLGRLGGRDGRLGLADGRLGCVVLVGANGLQGVRLRALLVAAAAILAAAPAASAAPVAAAALLGFAVLVFLRPSLLGLGAEQRLPVGDGDLVIVGMDFAEGQEAMAVAAILDERGLQGRLHPRHAGEVDISFELLLVL